MLSHSQTSRCPNRVTYQWLTTIALAAFLIFATDLHGQMNMAGHDMSAMKEIPPPDQLPPPFAMTGIGNSHLKITATPEAQVWFDQGLNLLHDFWDYESARSFQQAIRVDPNCAMCYWGLSRAISHYHSLEGGYSSVALDSAVKLEKHASKRERLFIEADLADRASSPNGPPSATESKAILLWREAVKKDPKDVQARIFLAESLMDGEEDSGEPKPGTAKGIAVLEEVLKSNPDDSAANHYWIHTMEPSSHPERAIASAKKLASLAPASGHMVHMPGHIFYRTGNYAEAEHWFAASTAVDEAYMKTQHVGVDDDWNYVHNLMYGIANLMEEGKLQQATTLSGKLAAARGQFDDTLYSFSPRDSMTRVDSLLPIALRTGDWKAVQSLLANSQPDTKLPNLLFLSGELKVFASGMQAVQSGDVASAQIASNALDADLWRKSQKVKDESPHDKPKKDETKSKTPVKIAVMPDAMAEPLLANLSIMSLELRASILASQKNLPEAKALFTQAAHEEKALGYREPPGYIRPVGETEGLALLQAGDAEGAHTAYAAALSELPNSGFSLYGLARSDEAAHNTDAAREDYVKFLDAWRNGDASSPELAHAHEYLVGESTVAAR